MTAAPLVVYPLVRFADASAPVALDQEARAHVARRGGSLRRTPSYKRSAPRRVKAPKLSACHPDAVPHQPESDAVSGAAAALHRSSSAASPSPARALAYRPRDRESASPPASFDSFLATLLFMYAPIRELSRVTPNLQQQQQRSQRIRGAQHAHRKMLEQAQGHGAAAVHQRDRVQGRSIGYDSHGRTPCAACPLSVHRQMVGDRSAPAAAPARPRSSTCCRASTATSPSGRSR